ncbi:MAG TPA: dihydropteroate synthase [Candidatus Marinimicrobia bacterium]|nr:dihydropteroate synthase [Candidatus Neomarinimicrobiota bacterium]
MTFSNLLSQNRTLIMGVLNVTPDSFSDGGEFLDAEKAVERAIQMVEEGADIIDIGGESSRPGADPVSESEELRRVLPVITALKDVINVPLSIDTFKASVAEKALDAGVQMINDISGLRGDGDMAKLAEERKVYTIIMHMKGTPKTMQANPSYDNLMIELVQYFEERIAFAFSAGITREKIILDPGIGFGKRVEDNFVILNELQTLVDLGYPVLVGPSRKSFIGLTLDLPENDRLEGTSATITAAVLNGAKIVRVHDVKEMRRGVLISDAIRLEGAAA